MGFKRFVNVIEIVVGVIALAFVIALFANEPGGESGGESRAQKAPGASIYAASCATCHGQDGQGGVGPRLAGQVVEDFPDPADQIAVVRNGRGGMPSFGGDLSDEEIAQVVEYTRTELGT